MERDTLIFVAILFLIVGFLFAYSNRPSTTAPYVIIGNPEDLVTFLDANTVIIRTVYPFSDAQGAVSAATYASVVLAAKGKNIVLQSLEDNRCYSNLGEYNVVKEVNLSECEANLPTIEIREGYGMIKIAPYRVVIQGDPPHLMPAISYVLKKIYPDADYVYARAFNQIQSRRRA